MNKKILSLALLLSAAVIPAHATQKATLHSPEPKVLCDKYICANSVDGVSRAMTEKYLGKKAATKVYSQGSFDPTEFTFSNGIFCDVKERLCREDRYFGEGGKRSGAVSTKYTKMLFGQ